MTAGAQPARAFVRSLNILVKAVRLYGLQHELTAGHLQTARKELETAVALAGQAGVLLGISGSQLLIDGVPVEGGPAERGLADKLKAAGVASIQFASGVTAEEFGSFIQAFAAPGAKPAGLAQQLRAALGGKGPSHIRLNEVRFVAEDSSLAEARAAAELTVRTLGVEGEKVQAWLNDPQKLLQLIAAAEGVHATAASVPGSGGAVTPGQPAAVTEDEVMGLMRLLGQLGKASAGSPGAAEPGQLRQQLAQLPGGVQQALQQALAHLAAAPAAASETPTLVRLAEHLAIRFALERYQRGEVRVNAVREMINRMGREIEALRKVLSSHEAAMGRVGVVVESHVDILDRQFWAGVPDSGKRSVLLSPEAWCVPPGNIAQFVEELRQGGEGKTAAAILLNYATCAHAPELEGRRKVALGLTELAPLYAAGGPELLEAGLRHAGAQLGRETEPELRNMLGATLVRLSREAATRHHYPALRQATASLAGVAQTQPALADTLRSRIGVEDHLPSFVEEALRAPAVPGGLADLLRAVPEPAIEALAHRFARCQRRQERERLVELGMLLGAGAAEHLARLLATRPAGEAASTIGLLSRLNLPALRQVLLGCLRTWNRVYDDVVVRQLGASGAPEAGLLLLELLEGLDPSVRAQAVDEIGLSGHRAVVLPLMRLARGETLPEGNPYLRVKALEALGRLREPISAPWLRQVIEARTIWRWMHPRELRIAAAQALQKIDPEWCRQVLLRAGLTPAELALAPLDPSLQIPWVRQRRYPRTLLSQTLPGLVTSPRGDSPLTFKVLSLGGALAESAGEKALPASTPGRLTLRRGLKHFCADSLVREVRANHVAFEVVGMDLEERSKLRRLLIELQPHAA